MDNKNVIFLLLFLTIVFCAPAQQHQVVVLKNERVLARYQVGDVLAFARATDKKLQAQRILALNDTLIIMERDSVAYYRIKKLDIRKKGGRPFAQKLGLYMMEAGVILSVADLVNTTLIQKQDASIDRGVAITSGALVAGGALLFFIKKPYIKPGRKHRVLIVGKNSPFYKVKPLPDPLLFPKN